MSANTALLAPTFRTVRLHGALAKRFSHEFRLAVNTPAEAVEALCMQMDGFLDAMRDGNFRVLIGGRYVEDPEHLLITFGKTPDMDIIPAFEGEGGNGGVGKILMGVAIVAVGIMTAGASIGPSPGMAGALGGVEATGLALGAGTGILGMTSAQIIGMGVLVGLSGVTMALSPTPSSRPGEFEKPEQRGSTFFNSQITPSNEGGVMPIGIGHGFTSGTVLSASIHVEQVPLSEILEDEIEVESRHWVRSGYEEHTDGIGPFEVRGFGISRLRTEFLDGGNHTIDGCAIDIGQYRQKSIGAIAEIHDQSTDEYFFQVDIINAFARNFFDLITILDSTETTEILQFASTVAIYGTASMPITAAPHKTGSRWKWSRGVGVGFALPISDPNDFSTFVRVVFGY